MPYITIEGNEPIQPANANQAIIDSLTGYPCAQSVLAALPSVNNQVKAMLSSIYGVNDDVDIIFMPHAYPAGVNTDGAPIIFGLAKLC